MEIKEQTILRLTIEYPNISKEEVCKVLDYLDERFGKYTYIIKRNGPKSTGPRTCDSTIGQIVVDVITTGEQHGNQI